MKKFATAQDVAPSVSDVNQDYYATPYIAEIVNTLTNLLFMYLAFKGIASCRKNGHDTIFLVAFVGYFLVGTGSFLFHASLKCMLLQNKGQSEDCSLIPFCENFLDPMQLVDELSMIYTTCLMCYATFSYSKSRQYAFTLALGLVSLAVFITLYYHYLQDPAFHQNAYAILTAVVLARSMYVMEFSLRPSLTQHEEQYKLDNKRSMTPEQKRLSQSADQRDAKILTSMWVMIGFGLGTFLTGFGIWQLDNEYCSTIRSWRRELGLPWGVVLEGHGWW